MNTEENHNLKEKPDYWIAKMKWSSRRGMLEVDYFLQAFLESHQIFTNQEKKLYEQLLQFDDNLIFNWLTKKSQPSDKTLIPIINKIRDCTKKINQKVSL